MSNPDLVKVHIAAVTDDRLDAGNPNYPDDPGVKRKGMCSRFCRCATRLLYGPKYQGLFGSSAIETGENFRDAGFAVSGPPETGDFLIKMVGSGGFGHIGAFVGAVTGRGSGLVASNSSTGIGRVSGAKGFRTLAQFGHYDLIGRLPVVEKIESTYRLFLNDRQIAIVPIRDGRAYCKGATWASALGVEIGFADETQTVLIGGRPLPAGAQVYLDGGRAFVWIHDLVQFSALKLTTDSMNRKITVTR